MAAQHREAKMLREILVVKSDLLYTESTPWGFIPVDGANFEKTILENFEYQQRGAMEEDLSYQQPIPYVIIKHASTNKFIAYKRGSSESTSGEQRLYGKRSLGVGGHIEKDQENDSNPVRSTALIEIEEEIGINDIQDIHLLGYIRDKTVPVNLYHIGHVYIAETNTDSVEAMDGELEQVYYKTEQEIDDLMNHPDVDMESWSVIAWKAYKDSKNTPSKTILKDISTHETNNHKNS